jgi:DNA repair exonuclease SbcCD ATPase subunit
MAINYDTEYPKLQRKCAKQQAEIERLQKRVSDADECIEEQEEMLEHLIVDQGQYKKEIERLKAELFTMRNVFHQQDAEIERLREALAKSCEEGRDEMYDCGYNRLRAALEEIAKGEGRYSKDPLTHASNTIEDMIEIAREALTRN